MAFEDALQLADGNDVRLAAEVDVIGAVDDHQLLPPARRHAEGVGAFEGRHLHRAKAVAVRRAPADQSAGTDAETQRHLCATALLLYRSQIIDEG